MKKLILLVFLLARTFLILGQTRVLTDEDYKKSGAIKLTFVTSKEEAIELAKKDIEKETPFIFLKSGIAPVVYSTDSIFEGKYKVYYYEQGCVGPDYESMREYNYIIFDFLTDKYGNKWRKEIRMDVVGFKEWKRRK